MYERKYLSCFLDTLLVIILSFITNSFVVIIHKYREILKVIYFSIFPVDHDHQTFKCKVNCPVSP